MADSPYFDSTYFDSTYFDSDQPASGGRGPAKAVQVRRDLLAEDDEHLLALD